MSGSGEMVTRECPVHGPLPEKIRGLHRDELHDDPGEQDRCPVPRYDEEPCGEPLGPPVTWTANVPKPSGSSSRADDPRQVWLRFAHADAVRMGWSR